jgi:PKD repeat protein
MKTNIIVKKSVTFAELKIVRNILQKNEIKIQVLTRKKSQRISGRDITYKKNKKSFTWMPTFFDFLRLCRKGIVFFTKFATMRKFIVYIGLVLCFFTVQAQQAGFTVSQPSKCVPSTVTFTNTSTGSPSSYLWNFGDGTPTSTSKDPQHPFQNAGTYTVTLTTYYGSTPSTSTHIIIVLPPPAFTFRKLNDSVCPGGNVSFSSIVTYPPNSNAIRSYLWNFGDGGSSTVANPTYTY